MGVMDEYQVGTDGLWSEREAAHLYRRAGFGGTPEQRLALVGNGSQEALRAAVDQLVNIQADDPYLDGPAVPGGVFPGAPFANLPDSPLQQTNPLARFRLDLVKNPVDEFSSAGQWLYRMRYTSQPLQEQLSLFLHDHMVSEAEKVQNVIPAAVNLGNDGSMAGQQCTTGTLPRDPNRATKMAFEAMRNQIRLFRRIGTENFRNLLLNITRDAAMLVYLDNVVNVRGRPQENYARELMELFSMGVGNYSENDVREIAKCLTGETFINFRCQTNWSTTTGFNPLTHEPGNKIVFGQTILQDFTGRETENVIDLIMNKVSATPPVNGLPSPYNTLPATAVYMSWKLLQWFVSHDIQLNPPDPAVLELAHYMRGTDNAPYPQRRFPYDFRAVLRKLFLSKFFFDETNYFTMYKNPVDYIISALRTLELDEEFPLFTRQNTYGPAIYLLLSGMRLFNPPDVSGWNHGKAWMNSGNIVMRYAYAYRLVYVIMLGDLTRISNLLAVNGGPLQNEFDHEGMIEYFGTRLIQEPFTPEEYEKLLAFLAGMPGPPNELYYRKILGLVHLMMTMPRFHLK